MDALLFNPILVFTISFALILTLCLTRIMKGGSTEKKYHPVACTVLNQLLNFPTLHDYMTRLARKYKTYRSINLFHCDIFTVDPANIEYILKTNFANYGKGSYHHSILKDFLGDGIFTVDGEKWRHQRKTSSYVFATKILRDFSNRVFKTNAAKLASKVSEAAISDHSIEIEDLFVKSTFDSILQVIFGLDMSGTNEEYQEFFNCLDEANATTIYRYFDIFWKIKKILNIGSEAKLKMNIKIVDDFVNNIIRRRTEQVHKSQHDQLTKEEDILSRFLDMNEKDAKYLKDIILNFIVAGKDTTASTLSWFFYMMCKHPHLQEKIAEEVIKATEIKENSSISELANHITEKSLEKMQYLHAALTETLRLYPAVPLEAKECFSDDILPDGFCIKKGDIVSFQPWVMGRMKFIWGDDARHFHPERWLDKNGDFHQQSPFKFVAFQAGPRMCLGKEFAYRQMKIFAAVLLGNFRFKLSDESKEVKYKTMLTLHIEGGLHLCASRRFGPGMV